MKNVAKSFLVLTVIAICAVAVQAQTSQLLKADVPFSFSIGDQQLSSGHYVISSMTDRFISVQDSNGGQTAIAMTIRKESPLRSVEPKLVFHRYGDQYVLAEIWADSGRELPKSAREKELAKAQKAEVLAVMLRPAR